MVLRRTHCVRRTLAWMRRWGRNDAGNTSIEFGFVALPFLMLLFGIMSVCLYFFVNFTLENAVWQTSRALRTGQVQQSQGAYSQAQTTEDRKKAFKKTLCAKVPGFIDCDGKAIVIVQSNASFGGIAEPQCATNGVIMDEAAATFDTGGTSSVVLVTVCYPWEFGGKLPFIRLGNLADGSLLMQASVAFRAEPY